VLTSPQLAAELEGVDVPVETIENFMDQQEVKDILEKYVD
jgi:PTS system ascorbate-specific IIB component